MKSLKRIRNFFLADPIRIGAQKLTPDEILKIMQSKQPNATKSSPFAELVGILFGSQGQTKPHH